MTIQEHDESMTIYYSKKTGEITVFCSGIQDMNYFSGNKEDFEIIWDYVVLPRDQLVLDNTTNFKINLETKALEIKPEALQQNSYPIASS